jgi:hypothetical protein
MKEITGYNKNENRLRRLFAYDPWGNRRNPDDWTQRITTPVSDITARGYTMHSLSRFIGKHLDGFALMNMFTEDFGFAPKQNH